MPKKVSELIEAGSFNEALKLLDCNADSGEKVVNSLTEFYKKKKNNQIVRRDYINGLILTSQEKTNRLKPVNKKIIELENRINGIEDRIMKFKEKTCAICVSEFNHPIVTPCCQNVFCLQCILQSQTYSKDCPFCRQQLDIDKIHAIVNDLKDIKSKDSLKKPKKNKIESLIDLLKTNEQENRRTLVFSKYDSTFSNIITNLKSNELKYELLKGSNASIRKKLERFTKGDTKIILLNSENMGSGLNLHIASDIVIFHNLNCELEKQVIGRANRMGRVGRLRIYYLKYETEQHSIIV